MSTQKSTQLIKLVEEISACTLCEKDLELGPRPVLQVHKEAKILISGQAPGIKVHQSGVPFDDASGERLRLWMGINRETFYDPHKIAILPMGFCYPGKAASGDLPPMKRCAETWRSLVLEQLSHIQLNLVIGTYAQHWHLGKTDLNLTETVRTWKNIESDVIPLPHPSPRNNIWLKKNPWFEKDVLPVLRGSVRQALGKTEN